MQPNVSIITLGVADLERTRQFYCGGLNWKTTEGSSENIVFIRCGGVVLALYDRDALAEDATVEPTVPTGFAGFTLAQNLATRAEVDAALEDAEQAGATLVKPAEEVFWGGYSGYFADPDGYLWEVAHNPFWVDDDGEVQLPG